MNNFSKNLKHYRILCGLTQKQMAEQLQIIPNAYQKYELGTREPKIDILIAIAEILNITLDNLITK